MSDNPRRPGAPSLRDGEKTIRAMAGFPESTYGWLLQQPGSTMSAKVRGVVEAAKGLTMGEIADMIPDDIPDEDIDDLWVALGWPCVRGKSR